MDRYKSALEKDVRLLRRNLRNHLISQAQIKELQESLPDCSDNARWLHQDGTPCDQAEEEAMLRLHKEGWIGLTAGTEE